MKSSTILVALFLTVPVAPVLADTTMGDALQQACGSNGCIISDVTRETFAGGLAHYSAKVRVGVAATDVVRIHRVVKELRPWIARPSAHAVFMVHPEPLNFKAAFLTGPLTDAESSITAYWAANDLDVWGIDLRATQVPDNTVDFSFMANWDLDLDATDTQKGLLLARAVRGLTGSGLGKMKLFGYARGGQIAYRVAAKESQRPSILRSVNGLLPMEILMETDDESLRTVACDLANQAKAAVDAGVYNTTFGGLVKTVGTLATQDPSGPSPIFPGLTNYQLVLFFGGLTTAFGEAYTPTYHLSGASFGPGGPTDFLFTDPWALVATMAGASIHGSQKAIDQGDRAPCENTPFDDHLEDISIPVFYTGANGGIGHKGDYTTTLLASTDVTTLVISLLPPEAAMADFGHDDIIRSSQAQALVWQPILSWIKTH